MKNVKLLKAHCEKVYNQRIKQAKRRNPDAVK